jgi:DNA gyrase/topoisomerase IV subunit A
MADQSEWPPDVRAGHVETRLHLLDGFDSAFIRREEIAQMIWNCESPEEALNRLMNEPFGYSETQAHHILDQPLRGLTRERLRVIEAKREALLGDV